MMMMGDCAAPVWRATCWSLRSCAAAAACPSAGLLLRAWKLPLRCKKHGRMWRCRAWGLDGRLSWRPSGEKDWRRCAKKPGEYESVTDDCARLCDDAGEFYTSNITGRALLRVLGRILPSRCDLRRTGIYKTALRRRQKIVLSWALAMRNQASRNPGREPRAAPKTAGDDDLRRSGVSGSAGKGSRDTTE
ncbi:Trypomastigote, Alanine, Serine and Valine rich protein (TASV), subfamily A [Trypanosoma cruzi]|uniref:Trypomastigote, Alanine, Serine and Valine rich protein (TASV), subfamily A n=1 Tax=Trypanosoma cruzi TaxID=5693 RepID=A0A2V2ULZ2_TRYCR|nr:Trypomastigote, Alanine, Serine and Valine rich protein (TASV), subfamily A [Trypanosoma cruzi]